MEIASNHHRYKVTTILCGVVFLGCSRGQVTTTLPPCSAIYSPELCSVLEDDIKEVVLTLPDKGRSRMQVQLSGAGICEGSQTLDEGDPGTLLTDYAQTIFRSQNVTIDQDARLLTTIGVALHRSEGRNLPQLVFNVVARDLESEDQTRLYRGDTHVENVAEETFDIYADLKYRTYRDTGFHESNAVLGNARHRNRTIIFGLGGVEPEPSADVKEALEGVIPDIDIYGFAQISSFISGDSSEDVDRIIIPCGFWDTRFFEHVGTCTVREGSDDPKIEGVSLTDYDDCYMVFKEEVIAALTDFVRRGGTLVLGNQHAPLFNRIHIYSMGIDRYLNAPLGISDKKIDTDIRGQLVVDDINTFGNDIPSSESRSLEAFLPMGAKLIDTVESKRIRLPKNRWLILANFQAEEKKYPAIIESQIGDGTLIYYAPHLKPDTVFANWFAGMLATHFMHNRVRKASSPVFASREYTRPVRMKRTQVARCPDLRTRDFACGNADCSEATPYLLVDGPIPILEEAIVLQSHIFGVPDTGGVVILNWVGQDARMRVDTYSPDGAIWESRASAFSPLVSRLPSGGQWQTVLSVEKNQYPYAHYSYELAAYVPRTPSDTFTATDLFRREVNYAVDQVKPEPGSDEPRAQDICKEIVNRLERWEHPPSSERVAVNAKAERLEVDFSVGYSSIDEATAHILKLYIENRCYPHHSIGEFHWWIQGYGSKPRQSDVDATLVNKYNSTVRAYSLGLIVIRSLLRLGMKIEKCTHGSEKWEDHECVSRLQNQISKSRVMSKSEIPPIGELFESVRIELNHPQYGFSSSLLMQGSTKSYNFQRARIIW